MCWLSKQNYWLSNMYSDIWRPRKGPAYKQLYSPFSSNNALPTLALPRSHIIKWGSSTQRFLPECGKKYLWYWSSPLFVPRDIDRIHMEASLFQLISSPLLSFNPFYDKKKYRDIMCSELLWHNLFFFSFGWMQKFPGQWSNLSHIRDKTKSLTVRPPGNSY